MIGINWCYQSLHQPTQVGLYEYLQLLIFLSHRVMEVLILTGGLGAIAQGIDIVRKGENRGTRIVVHL
jgi:hypothetical protein